MADLRGRLRVVALQRSRDLGGRAPLQLGGIRTVACGSRQAVVAEAEPEQQPRRGTELDEVALVVGAVLERVVVQRLAEHGADAAGRDVSGERERVGADVRVGRAQLGQAGIAEAGLLGEARIAVLGPVDVQEDRPRLHGQVARTGGGDEVAEWIGGGRECARARLDRVSAPARRIGPEEDLPARLVAQTPRAGVREDVARRVVGRGHGHTAEPGTALDVVEHRAEALVGEVAREAEGRRPHATPHQSHTASATTEATSTSSSTPTYSAEECACAKSPGP